MGHMQTIIVDSEYSASLVTRLQVDQLLSQLDGLVFTYLVLLYGDLCSQLCVLDDDHLTLRCRQLQIVGADIPNCNEGDLRTSRAGHYFVTKN